MQCAENLVLVTKNMIPGVLHLAIIIDIRDKILEELNNILKYSDIKDVISLAYYLYHQVAVICLMKILFYILNHENHLIFYCAIKTQK